MIWDWIARCRIGWPDAGAIRIHARNHFRFEKGADLTGRLGGAFGDLAKLSCIDLGCGKGDSVIARQILDIPWRRLVSVEAFEPYLEVMRGRTVRAGQHDLLETRIEDALDRFAPGEIDVALLIDVIEHFKRRDAMRLLVRLERLVTRGIVLFFPLGDVVQDELDDNILQHHLSFWEPGDMARLGYDVEVYEAFHGQLDPPPSAAWAIKRTG